MSSSSTISLESHKTKEFCFAALDLHGTALFVLPGVDANFMLASWNISRWK